MEDGRIQDSQLSVSTYQGGINSEKSARLNMPAITGVSGGAWRADIEDSNPWIQVDFLRPVTVTGVITQGRDAKDQWVTKYKIKYSDDGITWAKDQKVCEWGALYVN